MSPYDIATLHARIDELQSKLDAETTALAKGLFDLTVICNKYMETTNDTLRLLQTYIGKLSA